MDANINIRLPVNCLSYPLLFLTSISLIPRLASKIDPIEKLKEKRCVKR